VRCCCSQLRGVQVAGGPPNGEEGCRACSVGAAGSSSAACRFGAFPVLKGADEESKQLKLAGSR
jgi:hypothetical protein